MNKEPLMDPLLTAADAARELSCGLATFWRGVRDGRFPAPFYVAQRAPRWRRSELLAALEATRMKPIEALASRRKAKFGKRA